jgi:hypothetical protein
LLSAFSIRRTQLAQVMPVTGRVICFVVIVSSLSNRIIPSRDGFDHPPDGLARTSEVADEAEDDNGAVKRAEPRKQGTPPRSIVSPPAASLNKPAVPLTQRRHLVVAGILLGWRGRHDRNSAAARAW